MSYAEIWENGETEQECLNVEILKWQNNGDRVLGKLLSYNEFDHSEYEVKCMQYVADTDEGKVSFVLGATGDKILARKELIGKIISVSYQGKGKTKSGKEYNMFDIYSMDGGK